MTSPVLRQRALTLSQGTGSAVKPWKMTIPWQGFCEFVLSLEGHFQRSPNPYDWGDLPYENKITRLILDTWQDGLKSIMMEGNIKIKVQCEPGMVSCAYNASTRETWAGGLRFECQLKYIMRPCLKNKTKIKQKIPNKLQHKLVPLLQQPTLPL